MGSAFFETKGFLKGNDEELRTFSEILMKYTGKQDDVYFLKCSLEEQKGDEIPFSASGPFGKYDRLVDIPIFKELSEAAPNAFFDVEVSGNTDFSEYEMKCQLVNRKLHIEIKSSDSADEDQEYLEYIMEKMPYEQFVTIYRINPDSLEEDSYEEFINDLIVDADYDSNPFQVEFTGFLDLLEGYGGETTLTEETYPEAVAQMEGLEILSSFDYREDHDSTVCEQFVYDPVAREWLE